MDDVILRIDNVSKRYKLGQIGGTTLRDELQRWNAKRRGKEDPTKKIGARSWTNGDFFMALDGITIDVNKGERVGIIGHNGAGKSTLLKLISRVTAPTSGMIGLNGRVASMLEVGTGFHGELTGRENIYMNGAILGLKKKEIDAKIEDIIDFSECRQFIDTPVKRYSSGMYVKLAFSVAAHLDSEIMIMDEVLAVGDVNFQQKCLEKMRSVAEGEGRTILYVSHNMNTIRTLCNRCVVLSHGKVIFDGDVANGIERYSLNNIEEHKKCYDVRTIQRKELMPGICNILSIDMSSCELIQGEDLMFTISIQSKEAIANTMLRFVIYDRSGTVLGTTYSEAVDLHQGISNVKFSFSTQRLAPDTYYSDLILLEYNKGTQKRHDLITKVMTFSVEETDHKYNMGWLTRSWGHIILDEIKVLNKGSV